MLAYAVIINRPTVDLKSLLTIWRSEELSTKKSENQSDFKILYIMQQIAIFCNDMKQGGLAHNDLTTQSFFIDI